MEKEFVKYEQALALKELGFDEPCFAYYSINNIENKLFYDIDPDDGELTALNQNQFYHNNLSEVGRISSPLYQQAFRWFREKYNLNGFIFNYSKVWNWKIDLIGISCEDYSTEIDFIHTYEEAEQACLEKLIEICKNK